MADRTYGDGCGIARALDTVGERWALLVVRELVFGPKRFVELQRGLSGISANVLSQRLHELEDDGVIRRTAAGPPTSAAVYALTRRGRDLEPVLEALAAWGSLLDLPADATLTTDALMFSLRTTFGPVAAADLEASIAVRIGTDRFTVTVSDGQLRVERGEPGSPDAVVSGDAAALRALVYGRRALTTSMRDGSVLVDGSVSTVRSVLRCFARPAPSR